MKKQALRSAVTASFFCPAEILYGDPSVIASRAGTMTLNWRIAVLAGQQGSNSASKCWNILSPRRLAAIRVFYVVADKRASPYPIALFLRYFGEGICATCSTQ